jgi:mannose-6-phosphate isomerase-like protein (cupin superfamily)
MGLNVIPPGGGEVVGDKPERRVEILSDRDPLHATLSRFGPGMEGADLHVHHHHTDCFYVLEGELTVRLGAEDRQVRVPAGSLAWVPPDVVHGFRNASDADFRYLNFHAPGSRFADYLRSIRDGDPLVYDQHDPPADGGRPIDEAHVTAGEEIAEGVTLLADLAALRITRETRATEPRRAHALSSYFALGDLKITHGAEEVFAPAGSFVQVPAGHEHAVDGCFLAVVAPSAAPG